MSNLTSAEVFDSIVNHTVVANATTQTGYCYRPRSTIKHPRLFPVTASPPRTRSRRRVNRGYKTTPTVTMPIKHYSNRVSKADSPAPRLTAEQKAAIRPVRLEARRFAKLTPYVPKARAKRSTKAAIEKAVVKKAMASEPRQVLTFAGEHVETIRGNDDVVSWLAKAFRWYTSLVGFSVFTPVARQA